VFKQSAVVDVGFVRLRGATAWWLWGIVHVLFLLGSRNRVAVVLNWIWSYVTYRASTRLITGNGNQMMSQESR
jgi:NADH dehydrogenase FAD-containing subunit